MAAKWLVKRWGILFPALEQAETEAEVEAVCTAEKQAWLAQPSIKKESSLRNHMTATRHEIETRLQGDRQVWALKHLSFGEQWYRRENAPSRVNTERRLENQQFLKEPDVIVATGVELLASDQWAEIALGLAVCTGRRPGEVLKTAIFEPKTAYSVLFIGHLKRRSSNIPPYEIPTLCTAAAAIDALARLRSLLPTSDLDISAVTNRYSPAVKEAANKHFAALVPVREGDDDLYGQLFRAVYARIAVFWYCPPSIDDRHYMATIQGHTQYFDLETEEARRSYASNAHYSDYKIADGDGNIDGRQGLKLGTRGVELLEVFKARPRKEKKPVTTETQEQDPAKEGKNRPITVDPSTFSREMALKARLGHKGHAETINFLMDFYEAGGSAPVAAKNVADAIRAVLHKDKEYQEFRAEDDTKEAAAILEKALTSGENLQAILVDALIKEAKFRVGLTRRHAGKDFAGMTTSQLTSTKHPDAARERIRRAVAAIAAYNDAATSANDRWFINARTVQLVAGARYPIVEEWCKAHEAEIKALNEKHQLNQRYNSKPVEGGIKAVVTIPEQPAPIQAEQPAEVEQVTPAQAEQVEVTE
jgi:hypothetical protein